jgi:hypothetical protein
LFYRHCKIIASVIENASSESDKIEVYAEEEEKKIN